MPRGGQYEPIDVDTRNADAVDLGTALGEEAVGEETVQELHAGGATVLVQGRTEGEVDAAHDPNAITVKVKGSDEKNYNVRVSAGGSVRDLKTAVQGITGVAADRQRLICAGKLLVDEKSLKESNVNDGTFVHLVPKAAPSVPLTRQGSSNSTGGGDGLGGLNDVALPPHIRAMLASRADAGGSIAVEVGQLGGRDSDFSYEDEYELNIWRYRVRMIAMLMLFYYFMALMASVSLFLHPAGKDEKYPQEGQFRQIKPDLPLQLVDLLENSMGIAVAVTGLKTAVSNSPMLSKKFGKELFTLSFVHFLNLMLWIVAFLRGEIIMVPLHHRVHRGSTGVDESEKADQDTVHSIVLQLLIIHPLLWATMLNVAWRYHKSLSYRESVVNPPVATPVTNPSTAATSDVENGGAVAVSSM